MQRNPSDDAFSDDAFAPRDKMKAFWTLSGIAKDRPALIRPGRAEDGASVISYGQLSAMADARAAELRALAGGGVPLVMLDFATSVEAIAAYLAVLRCGYPLLVSEPGTDTGSRLHLVWTPDIHLQADASGGIAVLPRPGWQAESRPDPHPELRLLLSTSGSTGEPKLVRLSAENIASNATAIAEYLHLTADDRAATTLPLFYSYGLSVLNSYLDVGAALVLTAQSVTEPAFFETARAAGVTSLALVPHQFDLLAHSGFTGAELPALRYITQAGGRLSPDLVARFCGLGRQAGWDLVIMYGQTEAAPRISYVPPEALPAAAGTIGRPIPGGRIWLADEDGGEIAATGQPGELVYEGPNVMMGYASDRAGLAAPPGPAVLRSGDIAERTAEGYFRIVGRMKRFVKLFGLRLSLDQIELLLRENGIAAHAVSASDRLVLLLRDDTRAEAARQVIATRYGLPPDEVHTGHLADLPLLPSGKTDQQALGRIAAGVVSDSLAARRRASEGASLADILRDATRSAEVRPTDSFTGLGGDSLSYLSMQMVLEERLGAVPPGWENMTLAQLQALRPTAAAEGAGRRGSQVGADILLRLLAIAMIVIQHASTYSVFGGTWILIAVMGYSMARFQLRQIAEGRAVQFFVRMLYPIVPLYFLLLFAYALLREKPPLSYFLLVGNYEPWAGGSLLVVYWFVSLYAQIVLVMALVTSLPALRSFATQRSWQFGVLASGLLIAILAGLVAVQHGRGLGYFPQRGLPECLSVFAIGWMLRCMQGRVQILATVALAVVTLGLLSLLDMKPQILAILVPALIVLGLGLSVPTPRGLGRGLNLLATVTLYVYLLHEIIIFFLDKLGLPDPVNVALSLSVSFALAILARNGFERLDRSLFGHGGRQGRASLQSRTGA